MTLRPPTPKRGSQTKIFFLIRYQGPKINILWKFEGPSLRNKNVKISTLRAPTPKRGPQTKMFFCYDIRDPKSTTCVNLKFLAWIIKKLKILPVFESPSKFFVSQARTFKFKQDLDFRSLISYKKKIGLGPPFGRGGPEVSKFWWVVKGLQKCLITFKGTLYDFRSPKFCDTCFVKYLNINYIKN